MPPRPLPRRSFIGSLAAAATLVSSSLLHGQQKDTSMSSNRLTGNAKIRIRRSPADVFNAFADPKAMSKFWFTRRDEGLQEGKSVTWYMGSGENAMSFDIRVKEVKRPNSILIEWENGGEFTQVRWTIKGTPEGEAILMIEESGFTGSQESIIRRALDSTGGFNQVIVAAKAFIEHGVAINVVADHA